MHSLFHLASYSYSIDTQVAKCCVTLSGWIGMDWQPLRLPPHPSSRAETLFIRIQAGRVFAQYSQFLRVFARTSCAHYTIMPSVSSTASLCFCRWTILPQLLQRAVTHLILWCFIHTKPLQDKCVKLQDFTFTSLLTNNYPLFNIPTDVF